MRDLELRAHSLTECAVFAGATLDLDALGDFDASPRTSESFAVTTRGRELVMPLATRAVRGSATSGGDSWHGLGGLDHRGDIDLLLWSRTRDCELARTVARPDGYPGPGGGQAMGWSPRTGVLLVTGGASDQSAHALGAMAVSLRDGEVRPVKQLGDERRAEATVTPSGDRLLVAGGFDPLAGAASPERRALSSAHFFDPATSSFTDRVTLADARAHHSAIELAAGDVLLVAGSDATGEPLRTLEAIAPDGSARLSGLATLGHGRISPAVVRLDDGRVLVAGGHDAKGLGVPALEWLDGEATRVLAEVPFPARRDLASCALPGGAALAVGGCDTDRRKACGGDPTAPGCTCDDAAADCRCDDPCAVGCTSRAVHFVTAAGVVERLEPLDVDPGPRPSLVEGTDGAPWLVGSEIRRYDPWTARFVRPPLVPRRGALASLPKVVAIDRGLFVWLDDDGDLVLRGFRHDTRSEFARDVAPLFLSSAVHASPSLPPSGTAIAWEPARGLVVRDSLAHAVVNDATYEALRLELVVEADGAPVILLGGTRLGEGACPWPDVTSGSEPHERLVVERLGDVASLSRRGVGSICSVPGGRLRVALTTRGSVTTVYRSVVVRRGGVP